MKRTAVPLLILLLVFLAVFYGNAEARSVCGGKAFEGHPKLVLECLHSASLRFASTMSVSHSLPLCVRIYPPGATTPVFQCTSTDVEDMPDDVLCFRAGDSYFCMHTAFSVEEDGSLMYDTVFWNEYWRYVQANDVQAYPPGTPCLPQLCPDIIIEARPEVAPTPTERPTPVDMSTQEPVSYPPPMSEATPYP